MLLLHQWRKVAAGVGIAPTSVGLRPAAHLSEPSGDMNESPSAWCSTVCRLSTGCSAVELRRMKNGGAPENRTLDALAGAAVFRTVSSSMPDVLLMLISRSERATLANWLPSMDLHHDVRCNRPTGSFTSPGKKAKLAPAPGFEPGTAAVKSGACKMIHYTLRAESGGME